MPEASIANFPTVRTEESRAISGLFLSVVVLLVGFGTLMVYSASSIGAAYDERIADGLFFFRRHLIYASIGLVLMLLVARFNYKLLADLSVPIYLGTVALLLAVLIGGVDANNARRWLNVGIKFQPSELAKISMVIVAATFASRNAKNLKDFKLGFVTACAIVAPVCALIIVQPDLGTTLFIVIISFLVLLAGGLSLRHVAIIAAIMMPLMIVGMFFAFGHVQDRILVFLEPGRDPTGKGHQILQSWIALGSGGMLGKGLGASTQKLFFLPEEHTDFIFAIVVEEMGFVGGAVLILLFMALCYAGFRVSKHAPDRFGALLSFGCTMTIVLQAIISFAVVTGAAPTKGISLPFISFGGTGIIVTLINCGLILAVARQAVTRPKALELLANERQATLREPAPTRAPQHSTAILREHLPDSTVQPIE